MSARIRISASFVAVLLVAAVWLQGHRLRETQTEHARRQSVASEAAQPLASPEDIAEIERLRQETRALPKLRNEVRQLRSRTNAMASLRTELQDLAAVLASITNALPSNRRIPTPEQGFVMNDMWANAGVATPEATIQTFFWAARQRNLEALAACLNLERDQTGLVNKTTGQWEPDALESLYRLFGALRAFRIVALESSDENKVRAQIQAAVDGAILKFWLTRIGQEWKLSDL